MERLFMIIKSNVEYNRNAIALLKQNNYPVEIIACAEQNVFAIGHCVNFAL